MPTSLAPSPMPKVVSPVVFTRAVTSAFCLGETRQQITAAHCCPTCTINPSCHRDMSATRIAQTVAQSVHTCQRGGFCQGLLGRAFPMQAGFAVFKLDTKSLFFGRFPRRLECMNGTTSAAGFYMVRSPVVVLTLILQQCQLDYQSECCSTTGG